MVKDHNKHCILAFFSLSLKHMQLSFFNVICIPWASLLHTGIISAIAFCPTHTGMLATGSYNQTTAIYSEDNMELLYILHGQEGGVTHVSDDCLTFIILIITQSSNSFRWNTFFFHLQVQFSKDGNFLYTGGRKVKACPYSSLLLQISEMMVSVCILWDHQGHPRPTLSWSDKVCIWLLIWRYEVYTCFLFYICIWHSLILENPYRTLIYCVGIYATLLTLCTSRSIGVLLLEFFICLFFSLEITLVTNNYYRGRIPFCFCN